jgi:hypothetical protein
MGGASLNFSESANVRYDSQLDTNQYRLRNRLLRYDYVNIPITLKLMTNEIGYFTYFGQFGVDISILASAKARDKAEIVTTTTDSVGTVTETFGAAVQGDFKGIYNQTSFANIKLRIGAGFEWNFSGNTSLVVSVSYHNGFIDLVRDANADKIANSEGLYRFDDVRNKTPFELNANLHHVALNVGILF